MYKRKLSYCLKCRENTERSKNPEVAKTNKERAMLSTKCTGCGSKKFRFKKKKQETSGLWRNLGLKTSLSKILILDDILI